MTGENGYPETPDWACPVRDEPKPLTIPPTIELGEN